MTTSLKGRIAAITGGASGIGLECARQIAAQGATVYLFDRDQDAMNRACAESGGLLKAVSVDLFDRSSIDRAVASVLDAHGRIDILHANAGAYVGGNVWEGDESTWDRMLNLNINAAFHSARAVMPAMMKQKSGDILLTSSVAGVVPVAAEPIYTASKHAVQAFTHTVRRQLAPHGIRVGAIQPGPVVTPLLNDWSPERLKANIEAGAMMQPADVAEAVVFMLTRRTGTVIRDLVLLPHSFDI